eukprot:PhF_6_TR6201/c0_g2_i1/m.9331
MTPRRFLVFVFALISLLSVVTVVQPSYYTALTAAPTRTTTALPPAPKTVRNQTTIAPQAVKPKVITKTERNATLQMTLLMGCVDCVRKIRPPHSVSKNFAVCYFGS